MQAHFDAIVAIRDALIAGNLDNAKAEAKRITGDRVEPLITSWREYVGEIRQWAATVETATGLEEAAAAAAELARACGHCHSGHSVPLDLGTSEPADATPGTIPQMRRHQWAAERMWEGLVGPSEARWNRGASQLVRSALTPAQALDSQTAARVARLAARVQALGEEAHELPATAWDTRSATYGRFLSTCAACHQLVGRTHQ
jgi:hypothetical protein